MPQPPFDLGWRPTQGGGACKEGTGVQPGLGGGGGGRGEGCNGTGPSQAPRASCPSRPAALPHHRCSAFNLYFFVYSDLHSGTGVPRAGVKVRVGCPPEQTASADSHSLGLVTKTAVQVLSRGVRSRESSERRSVCRRTPKENGLERGQPGHIPGFPRPG